MKLILRCDSSNEDWDGEDGDCPYALLSLTPETARHLLDCYEQFQKFRAENGAYEAYWFDSVVDFFSPWGPDVESVDPNVKRVEGLTATLNDGTEFIEVPDDFEVPDTMSTTTECDQLITQEDGVKFCCYPKHTNVEIRTELVPAEVLREVLGLKKETQAKRDAAKPSRKKPARRKTA